MKCITSAFKDFNILRSSVHQKTQLIIVGYRKTFLLLDARRKALYHRIASILAFQKTQKKFAAPTTLTSRKTPKTAKKSFAFVFFCRMNICQWIIYHHMRLSILHRTIYNTTFKFIKSKSFLVANFQLSPECCIKTACCQKLAKEKLFCSLKLDDKLYAVG